MQDLIRIRGRPAATARPCTGKTPRSTSRPRPAAAPGAVIPLPAGDASSHWPPSSKPDPGRAQRLLRHGDVRAPTPDCPVDRKHAVLRQAAAAPTEVRTRIATRHCRAGRYAARRSCPHTCRRSSVPPQLHRRAPPAASSSGLSGRSGSLPCIRICASDAQRPEDRQQKPQRRAALSRVQRSLSQGRPRAARCAKLRPRSASIFAAQRPQALHRRARYPR